MEQHAFYSQRKKNSDPGPAAQLGGMIEAMLEFNVGDMDPNRQEKLSDREKEAALAWERRLRVVHRIGGCESQANSRAHCPAMVPSNSWWIVLYIKAFEPASQWGE